LWASPPFSPNNLPEFVQFTHLITLTDQPRFPGSELNVVSSDDLVSAVNIFESRQTFTFGVIIILKRQRTGKSERVERFLIRYGAICDAIDERAHNRSATSLIDA